jgi:DICT domain-containing protein/signal transduction histidine kinase
MGNPTSIVEEMFEALPTLRSQMYFKTSLTALSHAMEDQVLAGSEQGPLIIASFQQERFYRQEAHRYERIGQISDQVYVLSAAETKFSETVDGYEKISFDPEDALTEEWHLVVIGEHYTAALICREHVGHELAGEIASVETTLLSSRSRSAGSPSCSPSSPMASGASTPHLDQTRRFEGIWTLNRQVSLRAADLLLNRIQVYRPDLAEKIGAARSHFISTQLSPALTTELAVESDPFAQRLITYLQAGQYKQLKAYRAIALQEQRARLINSITAAIRQSLNPAEIFAIATQELGSVLSVGRCIIYRANPDDADVTLTHEYLQPPLDSLQGSAWPLKNNPLYQWVKSHHTVLAIDDISDTATVELDVELDLASAIARLQRWQIQGCLLVPLIHKNRLLGMIELHLSGPEIRHWNDDEIKLAEAIGNQLGVALIQAEAYANLEDLNQQLADLERTRSNLIAITGHELRTPLSTIRVCLESLMSEPDMDETMRQVMLDTALTDAERMRKLVQDFLTLSRLESRRVEWNLESLELQECVDLALSSLRWQNSAHSAPAIGIETDISADLPLVRADGEWIVEVLSKLLDNACKFTEANGQITISASVVSKAAGQTAGQQLVEVTVSDTGRGIEGDRLKTVFERFYQEEGALRRSVGGTGLGLAICQQIIEGLGGEIWATSPGKNQGTQIHFTLPAAQKQAAKQAAKGTSQGQRAGKGAIAEPEASKTAPKAASKTASKTTKKTAKKTA